MKTLELKELNVNELSKDELTEITGGSFWSTLGKICGALCAIGLVVLAAIGLEEVNN